MSDDGSHVSDGEAGSHDDGSEQLGSDAEAAHDGNDMSLSELANVESGDKASRKRKRSAPTALDPEQLAEFEASEKRKGVVRPQGMIYVCGRNVFDRIQGRPISECQVLGCFCPRGGISEELESEP